MRLGVNTRKSSHAKEASRKEFASQDINQIGSCGPSLVPERQLRVIAGKYRGRTLKGPPSLKTRPTADRLRETVFNILAPRIEGTRFVDLCAGSGAVGIEALSRGAGQVTFVDRSRQMCALISENIRTLKIEDADAAIVCAEAAEFLRRRVKRSSK